MSRRQAGQGAGLRQAQPLFWPCPFPGPCPGASLPTPRCQSAAPPTGANAFARTQTEGGGVLCPHAQSALLLRCERRIATFKSRCCTATDTPTSLP